MPMSEKFKSRFTELVSMLGVHDSKFGAKAIGISRITYTNAYGFGKLPSTTTLRRIAKYFNVSVKYLLGETDEKQG